MRCPRCGKDNPQSAAKCENCGMEFTPGSPGNTTDPLPKSDFNEYKPKEIPPETGSPAPSKLGKFLSACAHAVFYVMVFIGCQSTVVGTYLFSLLNGDPSLLNDPDVMNHLIEMVNERTVLILLISNLLTVLLLCGLMHIRQKEPMLEFEVYPVNPFRFGTFALFGAAMNVFVSVTMSAIPFPEELIEQHSAQTVSLYGGANILLEIFSVAVVAGITEELIFRGVVMSRLRKGMGTAAAVVISAAIFGAVHGSVLAVIYAALLGLLIGAMYARYGSVVPGMVFHVFFNMTSYLLPEEGAVLTVMYITSIVLIVFCVWRIFIRFPVFNDIFTDVRGVIRPKNEEDAAILAAIRSHQRDGRITVDEVESLHSRWEANRKALKKEKKYGRRK